MILGVSGLGNTGSFALIDFLREYDEVYYNKYMGEFSFCYCPDGLLDLEHHIVKAPFRFQSSDAALCRFAKLAEKEFINHRGERHKYNADLRRITSDYIVKITQISWDGTWGFRIRNSSSIESFIQKVLFKLRPLFGDEVYIRYTNKKMRYSVRPADFLENTKSYLMDMIMATGGGKTKYTLIDQLFPGDNPESIFHFFDNPISIVVDRDPRDLYLLSKCDVHVDSTWIPTDTVEKFIMYYRLMRENADVVKHKNQVLRLQYERLIYEYDEVEKEMEQFLGIKHHTQKLKFFNPEISINNTQLFNKYPQFAKDVEKIEKELSDWIYDYSRFPRKLKFGRTF